MACHLKNERIMNIKVLEIFTNKLSEQTRFYSNVLGLTIIEQSINSTSFKKNIPEHAAPGIGKLSISSGGGFPKDQSVTAEVLGC